MFSTKRRVMASLLPNFPRKQPQKNIDFLIFDNMATAIVLFKHDSGLKTVKNFKYVLCLMQNILNQTLYASKDWVIFLEKPQKHGTVDF